MIVFRGIDVIPLCEAVIVDTPLLKPCDGISEYGCGSPCKTVKQVRERLREMRDSLPKHEELMEQAQERLRERVRRGD